MHGDVGHPGVGDHPSHAEVGQPARDVVDHGRSGIQSRASHRPAQGVDADHGPGRRERGHDGEHAAAFLLLGHPVGAGAGRLTADVDQVGPLGEQPQPLLGRGARVEEGPAVGEGVGGDVDHAHDQAAAGVVQRRGEAADPRVRHRGSVSTRPRGALGTRARRTPRFVG